MRERSWLDRLCAPCAVRQELSRCGLDCAAAERRDERARAPRARRRPGRRRRREYGEPVDVFEAVAKRWSLVFRTKVSARSGRARADRRQTGPAEPTIRGTSTRSSTSRATPAAWRRCCAMRELRSYLGRHQAKPIDAEAEKRAGWRERGIMIEQRMGQPSCGQTPRGSSRRARAAARGAGARASTTCGRGWSESHADTPVRRPLRPRRSTAWTRRSAG